VRIDKNVETDRMMTDADDDYDDDDKENRVMTSSPSPLRLHLGTDG
jgi:hypothetical protein